MDSWISETNPCITGFPIEWLGFLPAIESLCKCVPVEEIGRIPQLARFKFVQKRSGIKSIFTFQFVKPIPVKRQGGGIEGVLTLWGRFDFVNLFHELFVDCKDHKNQDVMSE